MSPSSRLRLRLHPYRLALRNPWPAAHAMPGERRGWLLELDQGEDCGWGECAPLPAAGTEDLAAAEQALEALPHESDAATLMRWADRLLTARPAAACALHTALLDLQCRQQQLPMRKQLHVEASDQVPVNGVAGALSEAALQQLLDAGYRQIKCKLGLAPWQQEARLLERLCSSLPGDVLLRLDANRAWSPDEARQFLRAIEGLPIESLEEPLRDPHPERLAELQAGTRIELALDESLRLPEGPRLLSAAPVRRLVLKPMAHGGPVKTLALARQARAQGMRVVISSTLESSIGLHAAAQLAAALGPADPDLAHGLATADWLATDLAPPPRLQDGRLWLDPRPGLGVIP